MHFPLSKKAGEYTGTNTFADRIASAAALVQSSPIRTSSS
jgi:hypothetical protein